MTTHVHVMYMIGKHIHAHNILIPNTFTLISPPMYMFVQNSEKKRTHRYFTCILTDKEKAHLANAKMSQFLLYDFKCRFITFTSTY